mgnify:CR=1 FL=1
MWKTKSIYFCGSLVRGVIHLFTALIIIGFLLKIYIIVIIRIKEAAKKIVSKSCFCVVSLQSVKKILGLWRQHLKLQKKSWKLRVFWM